MTGCWAGNALWPCPLLGQEPGSFWMPPRAASGAAAVDWYFYFIYYIALVFFVLIVGLMVFFAIRYRRRAGGRRRPAATHSLPLELTWSVVPAALVVLIFWLNFTGFISLRTAPQTAYEIDVYAEQWRWEFTYPNGHADPELHVPLDRAVRLVMHTRSQDVIHSLYIPAFRLKQDIVPGRYTYAWFRATRPGQYPLVCAEYCGTGHSQMVTRVVVHEPGGYERWLALADPLKRLSAAQYAAYLADPQEFIRANPEFAGLEPPASIGARVYRKKGCRTCHSVDGSAGVGPSFRGLFGRAVVLADGSRVSADENYLRRSILAPGAQVVAGFDAVMPPYQGRISDRQINALIEYIKSLRP